VALVIFVPFFDHWKVNGPVPDGAVLKVAGEPGQFVSEVKAVADTLVKTVSDAQLVALVQNPVTWTQ
jgi:hypothetical protein